VDKLLQPGRKKMTIRAALVAVIAMACTLSGNCQSPSYDGLSNGIGNLYRLSNARTFSIGPEDISGEKGKGAMATHGSAASAARDLGQGWKQNPFIVIGPHQTFTLADIQTHGAIQHIWMTPTGNWQWSILRTYWDDESTPSVEVPVGSFFAMGWGKYSRVSSLAVCVNPGIHIQPGPTTRSSVWSVSGHRRAE
jgi:hypothetical protein